MRINKFVAFMFFVLVALIAASASAQTAFSAERDNRYNGYPASLVPKPRLAPTAAELAKCVASEAYEPKDTHLTKYAERLKIAHVRVQQTDECTWMRTAMGDALVRRVAGTKVAVDELGRDLADLGSPTGLVCDNARSYSVPVNVPVATAAPQPRTQTIVNLPVRMTFAQPAPPVVVPPMPPAPPPVLHFEDEETQFTVSFGTDSEKGSYRALFYEAIANSGDAPQNHGYTRFLPYARFDYDLVDSDHFLFGMFFKVSGSAHGSTSKKTFDAIDGEITKQRTNDVSKDRTWEVKGGPKFAAGDVLTVAPYVRYGVDCQCQEYDGQGAHTISKETYKGLGVGVELSGATESTDHRVQVTGDFSYTKVTRKSWTQQTYQGIVFPRATNPDASGHAIRFLASVDVQIWKGLHANAGFNYLATQSRRTNEFDAEQHIGQPSVGVGASYQIKLGK